VNIRVEIVLVCNVQRTRGGRGRYGLTPGSGGFPGAERRVPPAARSPGRTREAGGRVARPAGGGGRVEIRLHGGPDPS
jgi:hypothetical protein